MNRIKKTISGRVDINNLLDRARKKKEKINKKKKRKNLSLRDLCLLLGRTTMQHPAFTSIYRQKKKKKIKKIKK